MYERETLCLALTSVHGGKHVQIELQEKSKAHKRMGLKTVGRFTLENSVLSGPHDYMAEQGNALVDKILAKEDTVFNMTADQSPDIETAILVRLQTDYAGWLGFKQAERWLDHD